MMPALIKTSKRKENGSRRVQIRTDEESRVEQQHAKDVNINTIMDKARRGIAPMGTFRSGDYGDFTGIEDYQSTLDRIHNAQVDFMELPSVIRKRFDNDPGVLLEFLSNPANLDEAVELGLVDPPAVIEVPEPPPPQNVQIPLERNPEAPKVPSGE